MSEAAALQTQTKASASNSHSLLVQRKCACGGSSGLTGSCSGCEKKKLLGKPLQPKLRVSEPGDEYEQEADRIADAVVAGSGFRPQLGLSFSELPTVDGDKLNRQHDDVFVVPEDENESRRPNGTLQREASHGGVPQITPAIASRLDQLQGNGQSIPARVRRRYESRLGHDFSKIRIHTDIQGDQFARALHAQAFTWGHHIVFRKSAYAPELLVGQRLLAHELVHTIQQRAVEPHVRKTPNVQAVAQNVVTARQPFIQKKDCNFYVYDSTESGKLGNAWKYGAAARSLLARGGYAVASSDTIEYMLNRILKKFSDEGCDCIEELQFWSHGSSGNAMSIGKTGDEITIADFNIPGLDVYGNVPGLDDIINNPEYYRAWQKWFNQLTWRQQLLVEVRNYICGEDAEVYYRSCSAFQGKGGQEFAQASANFWRSKVVGHTKLIALTQPGKKTLKPGQIPYWSETEGAGDLEFKKRSQMGETKPKKD